MTSHIPLLETELINQSTIPFTELTGTSTGPQSLRKILDEFGFAIVSGVVEEAKLLEYEKLWAEDLLSILDPSSNKAAMAEIVPDPIRRWPMKTASLGTKFASEFGLPQGRLAWAVRTCPEVRSVYTAIFGTNDLCVGCDNVFFNNQKCDVEKDDNRLTNLWPHADQNLHKLPAGDYECYQGVLYIWPSDLDSSATVVWPGSYKSYYPVLMNDQRWKNKGHFCTLARKDVNTFVQHARRIPVARGGVLLWNSKTIHQGWPNGPRLAVPICFEPKERRSIEAFNSKKKVSTEWNSNESLGFIGYAPQHPSSCG
jgi:hypothetical protein